MVTCCHLPVCPSIHPYGKIWRHGKHVNVIGHEWHRAIGNSAAGRVLSCVAIPSSSQKWSFEGKRVEVEYEKWGNRTWKSQMEFPGSLNRVESVIYFLTQYWQYITLPILGVGFLPGNKKLLPKPTTAAKGNRSYGTSRAKAKTMRSRFLAGGEASPWQAWKNWFGP